MFDNIDYHIIYNLSTFTLAKFSKIIYNIFMLTAKDLRKKFIDYFIEQGHAHVPSASLIPENDPTVLFTTAGMHPLVPYLMGETHPEGSRLVDIQKCIRTTDIEEVGDTTHHTFFEMMGNWSLGDYFKEQAIQMSWEFLTSPDWLNLDKEKLAVSVFKGDDDAPFDEAAQDIWLSLLLPKDRIGSLGKKDNWWGPAGQTGPCGPDTEIFYWVGNEPAPKKFDTNDERWVEIWNDVFMQYNKTKEGEYYPLEQKNVDTGMGLERTLAVLNGFADNYQTELWQPIIKNIEKLSGKKYEDNLQSFRIIADHVKAATMIMGDNKGIAPSNTDQGYIVRRLIRRAIRYGKKLGIKGVFAFKLSEVVIDMYKDAYPEIKTNKDFIVNQLTKEEEKFSQTLKDGLKKAKQILSDKTPIKESEFNKIMQSPDKKEILAQALKDLRENKDTKAYTKFEVKITQKEIKKATITGKEAFDLFQSFGFPRDMMIELAQEKNLFVDTVEFRKELEKHQNLSRQGAEQKFKGGLADTKEETAKLHTATHLLLAALRAVLGDQIQQKGSNITAERLRFDFNYDQKLSPEQKEQVESIVNAKISENMPISYEEMTVEEAKKLGAIGVFETKYGDKVKVYSIGDYSKEICGGPHAKNTGELGCFSIKKEESSSSGVRRIKAVLK
jgi:alanyl-tRNA synthetase